MDWFKKAKQGEYNLSRIANHYKESGNRFLTDSIFHIYPNFDDSEICRYIRNNELKIKKISKIQEGEASKML